LVLVASSRTISAGVHGAAYSTPSVAIPRHRPRPSLVRPPLEPGLSLTRLVLPRGRPVVVDDDEGTDGADCAGVEGVGAGS
jgi:hypothetical protein